LDLTHRISQIQLVMIPSTDQERTVAFYEALGFEKRSDIPWANGHRWIELYPPGAPSGLAVVPPGVGDPVAVQTGIILNTDDIDVTHLELKKRGFDVDEEIARPGSPAVIRLGAVERAGPVPPMFYIRDPDGNRLLIVQPG
jgi:catechol 2,3-dioxygenase-like lactoylglutathione lyase family enzyme